MPRYKVNLTLIPDETSRRAALKKRKAAGGLFVKGRRGRGGFEVYGVEDARPKQEDDGSKGLSVA
ncbi:unnamed protein product [Arabis nemorensis]|uniref:Uncharacterized protein n=1 Tax=Arabis nemorensis TaxID=586526 RepID=A0A565C4K7_9BRAS|nr:unnamed protein product [Arabis nemorensis]